MAKKKKTVLNKMLKNKRWRIVFTVACLAITIGLIFSIQKSLYTANHVPESASTHDKKLNLDSTTPDKVTNTKDIDESKHTTKADTSLTAPTSNQITSKESPKNTVSNGKGNSQTQSDPFRISFIYLLQASVYCSGGGDRYIVQIGDVGISLENEKGGSISYGYEVDGNFPNLWSGYTHTASVAKGKLLTSFNELYNGPTNVPSMAYTGVLYAGHDAGRIRAVTYSPNVSYSKWLNIPAQQHGETCE